MCCKYKINPEMGRITEGVNYPIDKFYIDNMFK